MHTTVKKPASIFKIMKAFWIYDAVLAILFFLKPIALSTDSDFGWWYLIYIYFCLSLIGAPILFGIWFGYHIGKQDVPFGKRITIGSFIFILNYVTYWIPMLLVGETHPWESIPFTLLPALGLTMIFLISSSVAYAFCI